MAVVLTPLISGAYSLGTVVVRCPISAELDAEPETPDAEQRHEEQFAVVAGEQRGADCRTGGGQQRASGARG
jgi:hypothetical protein